MTIESHTDDAKSLRTHTVRGTISLPDIGSFIARLYASPAPSSDFNVLWDLREADCSKVTQADIKELADFMREHWAEKRRNKAAIVVTGEFHFGLSRMYEQSLGRPAHGKIMIFRELDPASVWLSKPDSATPLPSP